jgi:hypothetical protein
MVETIAGGWGWLMMLQFLERGISPGDRRETGGYRVECGVSIIYLDLKP